jgi:4-amino-4-deoxy-L-arabinose transferase-like glycosyltransferase
MFLLLLLVAILNKDNIDNPIFLLIGGYKNYYVLYPIAIAAGLLNPLIIKLVKRTVGRKKADS